MKKSLFMMMCLLNTIWASAQFSGSGSGTTSDPYRIFEASELDQIRNFLDKDGVYFKLMDDIDLTEWINDNNPTEGWSPIGVQSSMFKGVLEGNGKIIYGLIINRPSSAYIGLFGALDGAIVKNLTLKGSSVTGANFTGALAGYISDSEITNVKTDFSEVSGATSTGGLVGYSSGTSTISSSFVTTTVAGMGKCHGGVVGTSNGTKLTLSSVEARGIVSGEENVGGLIGQTKTLIANNCSHIGDVTSATQNVGGMVGKGTSIELTSCTSRGDVTGESNNIGGVVGYCQDGTITSSAHYGNVKGINRVGGLVGQKEDTSGPIVVEESYTIGNVSGKKDIGGLVGEMGISTGSNYNAVKNAVTNYTEYYTDYPSDSNSSQFYLGGRITVDGDVYYIVDKKYYENHTGKFYDGKYKYKLLLSSKRVVVELSNSSYAVDNCTAYPGYIIVDKFDYQKDNDGLFYTNTAETSSVVNGKRYKYVLISNAFKGVANKISNSYFAGDVTGLTQVGGIVGVSRTTDIEKNYTSATISGQMNVGGIVGMLDTGGYSPDGQTFVNSSLTSNIAINSSVSASSSDVGRIYGMMGDNHWTIGALGSATSNKALLTTKVSCNGIEQNISENLQHGNTVGGATLKRKSTYQGIGWDMTNDWNIQETESYPYKPWQTAPPVILQGAVAGSTSVSGKSVDEGRVYVEVDNKQYTSSVTEGSWVVEIDPLQAGTQISAYAESSSKSPSYKATSYVDYLGSGTAEDPYQIYSASDLAGISGNSHYKLMKDIDLSEWINTNSPIIGWNPIGKNTPVAFNLDGNNHVISGLWTNSDEDHIGLIANASNATIKNLTIHIEPSKKVKGGDYTAALLGYGSSITISNCHITGNVEGKQNSALLAGQINDGLVDCCFVNGKVTAVGNAAGLIASSGAKVTNSSSDGTVTSTAANVLVGGLVGNNSGTIEKCFSNAVVKSSGKGSKVGGLVGYSRGMISISASLNSVSAGTESNAGGVAGETDENSIINDSYSTSDITGTAYTGGIVGYNYGKVNRCYASGSIDGAGIAAGISAYNCGAKAQVLDCVAISSKIELSGSASTAKRIIGGYKDGAPDPAKADNYGKAEMLIAINGTFQNLSDNSLNGTSVPEQTLRQLAFYNELGWNMSSLWSISENQSYPYIEFPNTILVKSIILSSNSVELTEGKTAQLTATIAPTNATIKGVTWTSDNANVAKVGANGIVTAVAAGKATITCSASDGSGVSATCIITVKENPKPCIEDGKYFIKNASATGTDAYLEAGADYGTHAMLGHGIDIDVVSLENEKYMLDTHIQNSNGMHVLGSNSYMDSNSTLYITRAQDNLFTISTEDGLLLSADGAFVSFEADGKNRLWQFVTPEERLTELNSATNDNPQDATWLIKDPDFSIWDTRISYWNEIDAPSQGGRNTNMNSQKWGADTQTFTVQQTLTLPNGWYKLSAQGFYRYNITEVNTNDIAISTHADGTEIINSYLFAGDVQVPLPSIADDEASMVLSELPMQQKDAGDAFEKGLYATSLYVEVKNGKLPIGVKKIAHPGCDWTVFDNFELTYYGTETPKCLLTYTPGDVNNDGEINAQDLVAVVNYILENPTSGNIREAADLNNDGNVDAMDYVAEVNLILSDGASSVSAMARAKGIDVPVSDIASLYLDPFCIAPGEEKEIIFSIDDINNDYVCCQFDVTLPAGISVIDAESEFGTHAVAYRTLKDGSTRLLLASTSNKIIHQSEGGVIRLTLKADKNMKNGQYVLGATNTMLVTANAQSVNPDSASFVFTVGDATGINSINASYDNEKRYNITGQRVNASAKGLIIVNGKKTIVK